MKRKKTKDKYPKTLEAKGPDKGIWLRWLSPRAGLFSSCGLWLFA
jgi:hypothetical protein